MEPTVADATHILTSDYRIVEKLFADFDRAGRAKKGETANRICTELKTHA